jgi:U4/U6 small nuclear ribonucleoprotein PRP3
MRVLANDAISDPTKIEAKVKREVAARRLKHEKTNKKNKLTHDQRKEKEAKEKEKDEEKGLYAAVFKCVLLFFLFPFSRVGSFAERTTS